MEKYLQQMLDQATAIGSINEMSMGGYIKGKQRIAVEGVTKDGDSYTLELIVEVAE